jgi:Dynamin GTPase effector domain
MKDHIEKCADAAARRIDSLLEEEKEPFTMNDHYFMELHSKFFAYYREARLRDRSQFIRNLENRDDGDVMAAMSETLCSLTKMGLEQADASLLANLLPPDPMDPAIEIMADVRAYFQGSLGIFLLLVRLYRAWPTCITVAYKRFVDNVPMGIDRTLVRGVTRDLEEVLLRGLSVNGPEGYERCKRLLSEPEEIAERRSELEKRRRRLILAKEELIEEFVWWG